MCDYFEYLYSFTICKIGYTIYHIHKKYNGGIELSCNILPEKNMRCNYSFTKDDCVIKKIDDYYKVWLINEDLILTFIK